MDIGMSDHLRREPAVESRSRMVPAVPFLLGLPFGLVCDVWWPWPIADDARDMIVVVSFGVLAVIVGLALIVHANRAMTRYGTSADIDADSSRVRRWL